MLETPVIAIEQSRVEVLRMAEGCSKMMRWLAELAPQEVPDQALVQKLFHREEVLDTVQDEVVAFLSDLLASNLPHEVIDEGRRQLRVADEYESISDYIASILKFHLKLRNQGYAFDDEQSDQLRELHDLVLNYLKLVTDSYDQRNPIVITKAHTVIGEIKNRARSLRDEHLRALTDKKIVPYVNVAFTSTLNSYVRVSDHTLNVAEALAGVK